MKYYNNVFVVLGVISGLFLLPAQVFALEITEIMYDLPGSDSDREWVEFYNNTAESLSMPSEFKLFENTVGHTINTVESYSGALQAGVYAVIADNPEKFLEDNVGYEGLLFQSSFSLSNTGEKIGIVNKQGEIISEVEYASSLGAKGTGNSLQLFEGVFIEGAPTPGVENIKTIDPVEKNEGDGESNGVVDSDISTHEDQITLSTAELEKVIYIDIGRERLATVGNSLLFEAAAAGQGARKKITYIWNFGDGTTKKGRKVTHTYRHKGHYNIVVNAIAGTSRAVARTTVAVAETNLTITKHTDGLYVINNASHEMNIGNFYIKNNKEEYVFPKDTIVSAQNNILFTWKVLGFDNPNVRDNESLFKLYTPNRKMVADSALE